MIKIKIIVCFEYLAGSVGLLIDTMKEFVLPKHYSCLIKKIRTYKIIKSGLEDIVTMAFTNCFVNEIANK